MNICIETPNKEAYDKAQQACFKHGWDWERTEYVEFFSDEWKEEESFILNDDGWHPDVTHLCVIDKVLCVSYADDGNPVDDGFELKTIEELEDAA